MYGHKSGQSPYKRHRSQSLRTQPQSQPEMKHCKWQRDKNLYVLGFVDEFQHDAKRVIYGEWNWYNEFH